MSDDLISCRHCEAQLPDEGGECPRCERDRDTGKLSEDDPRINPDLTRRLAE